MTRGSQSNVRGKGHQRLQQPPLAPIDPTPIRRALPAGERYSPRNRDHSIVNYARLERIEEIILEVLAPLQLCAKSSTSSMMSLRQMLQTMKMLKYAKLLKNGPTPNSILTSNSLMKYGAKHKTRVHRSIRIVFGLTNTVPTPLPTLAGMAIPRIPEDISQGSTASPKPCICEVTGTMEAFLRQAEPEISPEEAFLRSFIQTNQPFSLCDNPAFQGIYTSLHKACPFVSGDTFRRFAEQRFNQVRSHLIIATGDAVGDPRLTADRC